MTFVPLVRGKLHPGVPLAAPQQPLNADSRKLYGDDLADDLDELGRRPRYDLVLSADDDESFRQLHRVGESMDVTEVMTGLRFRLRREDCGLDCACDASAEWLPDHAG